jgi:hypothetical protein
VNSCEVLGIVGLYPSLSSLLSSPHSDRQQPLRLWSLSVKEFHQIRRNRRLAILLIIPPTLNILLFGLALNPKVENLRLGVADYSRTPASRELVSACEEGLVFRTEGYYASSDELGQAISRGDLDSGLNQKIALSQPPRQQPTGETSNALASR